MLALVRDELLGSSKSSNPFFVKMQHFIDSRVSIPDGDRLKRKYEILLNEVKAAHSSSASVTQASKDDQRVPAAQSSSFEALHQQQKEHPNGYVAGNANTAPAAGSASRKKDQSQQQQEDEDEHEEEERKEKQQEPRENDRNGGGAFNVGKLNNKGKHNLGGKKSQKASSGSKQKDSKQKKEGRRWTEEAASAADVDKTEGGSSERADAGGLARPGESQMDEGLSSAMSTANDAAADEGLAARLLKKAGGGGSVNEAELQPILDGLRNKLLEKNVAEEAASALCDSVKAELAGSKLPALSRLSKEVERAMQKALTRVLSPTSGVNVLREAKKRQQDSAKAESSPYIIIFTGVNGVGKSTTLAKVASWLLSNDVRLSVAACDTFRAGAIEQLRTHCHRLNVSLHERGYGKDAAKVSREAVSNASKQGEGVVLVDTAGRMQHNEQLMRELASIVRNTSPHMVLFVGEALVGNDGVDQLRQFNRKLTELTGPGRTSRGIDGISLTKMDTIDDKVGAAVSMAHASSAPIVFAGVGQTYADLVPLPVQSVVASLLK